MKTVVINKYEKFHEQDDHNLTKTAYFEGDGLVVSDGYHTFDELYEHRITLFIALCREVAITRKGQLLSVWRSYHHSDGSSFDGWFVMGIGTDKGSQITYHLPIAKWNETAFAETFPQAPEFDGHTPTGVLERLKAL
jgi:hypothetical protein